MAKALVEVYGCSVQAALNEMQALLFGPPFRLSEQIARGRREDNRKGGHDRPLRSDGQDRPPGLRGRRVLKAVVAQHVIAPGERKQVGDVLNDAGKAAERQVCPSDQFEEDPQHADDRPDLLPEQRQERNPKYVQKFASVWAERGWLSNIRVTADNPPKRLGRRVTRTLVRMAGLESKYKKIYQDLPEAAQSNTTSVDENG